MNELYKKHITIVLKEMCSRVGADFDKINFGPDQKPPYYEQYQWTDEEAEKFTTWLTDYMYNNSEARKVLAEFPSLVQTKKGSRRFAEMFIAWHGWKSKKLT